MFKRKWRVGKHLASPRADPRKIDMVIWLIAVVWLGGLASFVAVRAHVTKTPRNMTFDSKPVPGAQIGRGRTRAPRALPTSARQRKAA